MEKYIVYQRELRQKFEILCINNLQSQIRKPLGRARIPKHNHGEVGKNLEREWILNLWMSVRWNCLENSHKPSNSSQKYPKKPLSQSHTTFVPIEVTHSHIPNYFEKNHVSTFVIRIGRLAPLTFGWFVTDSNPAVGEWARKALQMMRGRKIVQTQFSVGLTQKLNNEPNQLTQLSNAFLKTNTRTGVGARGAWSLRTEQN